MIICKFEAVGEYARMKEFQQGGCCFQSTMIKEQAIKLLKVHPEEVRMVVLVSALFLCIQAGQGIGENAAFGLFLARVHVDRLPYMYIGLGAFVSLSSLAYATSLSRFRDASVVTYLLALSVFLFLGQWMAISIFSLSIYSILWLTTYGMSVILGTLLWTIAGSVCDARQAKRLFSLFASMGILGSVIGNLLTGLFASLAGTDNLIILYAILLGVGFFLTREITSSYFRLEEGSSKYSLINDMRAGFDFVRESQLFRFVALSSVLYSILFFTVDFPFSETLSRQFTDSEASLAGFKGLFTSVTTAITFLVSLFLANRLYARLGIIGSILIMPVTYVIAFVVFFVSFTFTGAVVVRFMQLVVLGGLMGTAWNALFNVVPPERRGQVLAFNNGVPAQIGVFLSGIMILLSRQVLETQDILLLGAFVALVSVYITLKMKPAYGDALLSALRSGRVEVFSDQDDSFVGYQNEPESLRVVQRALRDPKAHVRRLAVEMCVRMHNKEMITDLVDRLYDDEGTVRAAATRALAELGGEETLGDVFLGLDDVDNEVREETLASLTKLGVLPSPELIRTLEHLLKDKDPGVQAHAAIVLIALGETKLAQREFTKLMKHKDDGNRLAALRSLGHIASGTHKPIELDVDLILRAFQDDAPDVRKEAARIACYFPHESIPGPLAGLLRDEESSVRKTASGSLNKLWARSRSVVTSMLEESANGPVTYAILDSIPPGDPGMFYPLRGYIQRETSNIKFLRSLVQALPRQGRSVLLLLDTVLYRLSKCEERLIKAVGLFGNPRALDLIRKTLNAGDAATRAAALEALETLGDRRITQEVLPILDRGGVFISTDTMLSPGDAIGVLLAGEDHWLRALAARSIPELDLKDCVPELRKLKRDPNLLVKHAAQDALNQIEGKKMKTLKTLSTMDRILLLREVPMFAGLIPDDLERIAEIAQEQLYPTHALICREGDPGNALYIIVTGEVEVVKSLGKDEKILGHTKPGQFVGEMAILDSAPRSATLRALNQVRILSIEGDAFNMIMLDRPEVAISVLKSMSARVRDLNEKVGASAPSAGKI